jgi:hypothetical protein
VAKLCIAGFLEDFIGMPHRRLTLKDAAGTIEKRKHRNGETAVKYCRLISGGGTIEFRQRYHSGIYFWVGAELLVISEFLQFTALK